MGRMKRRYLSVLLLALVFACAGDGRELSRARPLRVLFIGNSYTYVNDLPWLTGRLASSGKKGRALEAEMVAVGGATLKSHWEGGRALEAVRKGRWDFVVLQEQGTLPIEHPEVMHRYARLFDAEIKRAGARTVFYLTWARQGNEQAQAALTESYVSIAKELGAKLAPVGLVWQQVRRENPGLKLYSEDGRHPDPAGSYLAACVFYVTFYGESPAGLSRDLYSTRFGTPDEGPRIAAGVLSPADAGVIQRAAWQLARPGAGVSFQ
jgi:hypothetical protein